MKNIFNKKDTDEVIKRIQTLKSTSPALWGTMNVSQMLAHCNVSYEMIYDNIHAKPNLLLKLILKLLVKKSVVGEKPYAKSLRTAPAFIIKDSKDFDKEKSRLIAYIIKTQELGDNYFDNKESNSFGPLTKNEWNNMLYKHLDHHLSQFGA
ncbi:MAG: DUF1569 domain-containing protein [Ignavibacteria bacterium]|nr:DUF1569 domain-containing protein [Ignavibacteria bacterium]